MALNQGAYCDPLWLHGSVWGHFGCYSFGGRALVCLDSLPPYTSAMKRDYPAQDTNRQETWYGTWSELCPEMAFSDLVRDHWSCLPAPSSPGLSDVTSQCLITKGLGEHCHYYCEFFRSINLILLNRTEASAEFPCPFLPWQNTVQIVSTLYLFVNPIDLVISVLGGSEMRDSKQSR